MEAMHRVSTLNLEAALNINRTKGILKSARLAYINKRIIDAFRDSQFDVSSFSCTQSTRSCVIPHKTFSRYDVHPA
jgi:hypothetical protein